jgi:Ca2+-binding EF-hand superfamily protein
LDEKLRLKHEAEELKFQSYFDDFDTNKNGILCKKELVKLLFYLQPDHVFPDAQIDSIVAEGM